MITVFFFSFTTLYPTTETKNFGGCFGVSTPLPHTVYNHSQKIICISQKPLSLSKIKWVVVVLKPKQPYFFFFYLNHSVSGCGERTWTHTTLFKRVRNFSPLNFFSVWWILKKKTPFLDLFKKKKGIRSFTTSIRK